MDSLQFILYDRSGRTPIQEEGLKDVFQKLHERLVCHNHKIIEMVLKICFQKEEEDLSRELECFKRTMNLSKSPLN